MISYIGDISSADAEVLKEAAETHDKILEFGCGASTQVLAKYGRGTKLVSIDTDEGWINKTSENLDIFGTKKNVEFHEYYTFMGSILGYAENASYQFIFDDGADSLRRAFAINTWPFLSLGGIMALHDTRREHDFRNVLEILAHWQPEIGRVVFNVAGSNITLIEKVEPKYYDNWQITEKKEPWILGYGEIPSYYKEIMQKSN